MLKTLEKACPLVIVPRSEVRLVFPFTHASSALNAPAITRDGGMLSILLFSAMPVWEPGPSGCFGGGIYRDGSTIDFGGLEGSGGGGYDQVTLTTRAHSSVALVTLTHSFMIVSEGTGASFKFIFSFWPLKALFCPRG